MAEDDRNYIDHTQMRAEAFLGRELSPDEMATEFAKWGMIERVDTLDRLHADLSGRDVSVREAAKLHGYERVLRNTHEMLRKVGR